jgi:hypothetical protein
MRGEEMVKKINKEENTLFISLHLILKKPKKPEKPNYLILKAYRIITLLNPRLLHHSSSDGAIPYRCTLYHKYWLSATSQDSSSCRGPPHPSNAHIPAEFKRLGHTFRTFSGKSELNFHYKVNSDPHSSSFITVHIRHLEGRRWVK